MSNNEQKFLENFKKRIIKDTLKTLFKKYHVYDNEENIMSQEIIEKELLSPKIIKRCIGTTNTSPITQCSKNALDDYDYCKIHMYKLGSTHIHKEQFDNSNILVHFNTNNNFDNLSTEKLKKKFIDDTFYLIDDKFIYNDNDTLEKVGIIDNNKYILTSDPFVLDIFH